MVLGALEYFDARYLCDLDHFSVSESFNQTCERSFNRKCNLKTHMHSQHPNSEDFDALEKGDLHVKKSPGKLMQASPLYNCLHCGSRFALKRCGVLLNRLLELRRILIRSLLLHLASLHVNASLKDTTSMKQIGTLGIHTMSHTHECPYCAKPFSEKGNLVTHIRTHTKKRLYIWL